MPKTIDYVYDDAPAPGTARRVAPGVYWIRMPLPFPLDHINLWLLEDGDGWTLIDSGFNTDETRRCWDGVFTGALGGKSPRRLICTHFHPDHMGLAGWLCERWKIAMWTTAGEWTAGQKFWNGKSTAHLDPEFFRKAGCTEDDLDGFSQKVNGVRRRFSPLPDGYRAIVEGEVIEIGGRGWRVITAKGHSPDHACLYAADIGVLIAGDQVLPRITPNIAVHADAPDANPLGDFLGGFEKFRALPAATLVLPSHIRPFTGLHARLDEMDAHHRDRLAVTADACASPATAAQVRQVLFKRELDAHQSFLALGETIAHLNYLMAEGRVRRQNGGGVDTYYANRS